MIDRKKRALQQSVYRLTLKTNSSNSFLPLYQLRNLLLGLNLRRIQEYRHCMLKIALIFISYFNNQSFAIMGSSFSNFTSELTGSIIHELVDSVNYGEQVTSSTVSSLVRWQIKQFTNHTSFSYSRFNKQLQPDAKQSYHNLTCTLASAKYLLSVYVQPNLTCT